MSANNQSELDQTALLLHAYADGELDPANALAMEQRMAADPQLAAEFERINLLRRTLRERMPPEPLPSGLEARIRRSIGATSPRRKLDARALAASIAVAAFLSSGATWLALQQWSANGTANAIVAGHIRALMAPQPTDVSSSDRHVVKPWFNTRTPQAPRVVDLTQDGFPLVGGRIDVVGRVVVPTLVYRHRQHLISLTAVPGVMPPTERRTLQGYNLVGWTADGTGYWAVSDLGGGDLDKFARLFRDAPPDR